MNNGLFCIYCSSKIFENDRTCPQCGAPTKDALSIDFETYSHNEYNSKEYFNEVSMIAGNEQELIFNIFDNCGVIIPNKTLIWKLYKYGTNNVIFEKDVTTDINGIVSINLHKYQTENLQGKYMHCIGGATGIITIFPCIV